MLKAANQVAWGFRTLFNQHDAVALLRKDDDDRYWRRVLTFGTEHNLQAVLDEYVHYLVDAEGLGASSSADRVAGVSKAIADALSIRQEDLLEYLHSLLGTDIAAEDLAELQIRLEP